MAEVMKIKNGKGLLPCPFCGSTKLKIDQKTSSTTRWNKETSKLEKLVVVTVRCNKCHTRGPTTSMYAHWGDRPTKILEEKAIEAWNTRTPNEEESLRNIISHKEAEIERLQSIIKEIVRD